MDRPLLLGHRGVRMRRGPAENTLAAFDLALEEGCDGFEFDVRLTSDRRAVVCHDPKVKGTRVERAGPGQLAHLPRLEHVLAAYGDRAFLDIELKVAGLEAKVVALLRAGGEGGRRVVSSFLPEVVEAVHALAGEVPLGIISDTRAQLARWRDLPVEYVIPHFPLATRELVDEVRAAGRKIMVWTVNQTADMHRLAEWGVHGIISDDAAALAGAFRRPGA